MPPVRVRTDRPARHVPHHAKGEPWLCFRVDAREGAEEAVFPEVADVAYETVLHRLSVPSSPAPDVAAELGEIVISLQRVGRPQAARARA